VADKRAQYHLRIQVLPGPDIEERAQELARFCRDYEVQEAVLFVAAEEWNDGLLSDSDLEVWCEALAICRDALVAAGIRVSVNPWYTVLHCDRGRRMPAGYDLTPMVSPSGQQARAVASLACPNWQGYIEHLYGRLAELGFRVLWVEDDFRYHNHAPLDWGGDFSAPMLERFAAKVGRAVTREEVVAAILQPGEPHPWRRLWLETWRENQLAVARRLREAVRAGDPTARLGLMSSHPSSHAIEGRDWPALFSALSREGEVAHRPHYTGYSDTMRGNLAHASFMLDYQKELRPSSLACEVAPEVETFPMSPYSTSDTVTWGNMALAQLHGADALLLDIFSFTCYRLAQEPWVGPLLAALRPGLDELARLFPPSLRTAGVGILWRPDAAEHIRTAAGRDMTELWVPFDEPAVLLQSLGIAVQARPGAVNCLWGPVAWAYSDEDLHSILAGRVWLDADAAAIIEARGLGQYLPVQHRQWWWREDLNYSLEHAADAASGLPADAWMGVHLLPRVACQELRPGAVEWTSLCDARGGRLGSGLALGSNDLGGRVAVCAWPLAAHAAQYPLSPFRQTLVQRLIATLAEGGAGLPVMIAGSPYTFPIDLAGEAVRRVAVFNASLDPQRPAVRIPGTARLVGARLLAARSAPRDLTARSNAEAGALLVELEESIPFCGIAVLTVQECDA